MKIGPVVFFLFVALVGYVGMQFLKPVLVNFRLKEAMEEQARMASVEADSTIARTLAEKAESLHIPLAKEDFRGGIERQTPGEVTIAVSYVVEVTLPSYRRTLKFHPKVTVQPMVTER